MHKRVSSCADLFYCSSSWTAQAASNSEGDTCHACKDYRKPVDIL